MSDWRKDITCPDCLLWEGKPPVPLTEGSEMMRNSFKEQGLDPDSFHLEHACRVGVDARGQAFHMPITVMVMNDGTRLEWLPESR